MSCRHQWTPGPMLLQFIQYAPFRKAALNAAMQTPRSKKTCMIFECSQGQLCSVAAAAGAYQLLRSMVDRARGTLSPEPVNPVQELKLCCHIMAYNRYYLAATQKRRTHSAPFSCLHGRTALQNSGRVGRLVLTHPHKPATDKAQPKSKR